METPINQLSEMECQQMIYHARHQAGIVCKKCKSSAHYWLEMRGCWQCRHCRYRTSLTSGTVMENTKLPMKTWLMAISLLAKNNGQISAKSFQKLMGMKRYEPAWALFHKIRKRMGLADHMPYLERKLEYCITQMFTRKTKGYEGRKQIDVMVTREMGSKRVKAMALGFFKENNLKNKLLHQFDLGLNLSPCDKGRGMTNSWLPDLVKELTNKLSKIHRYVKKKYINNYLYEWTYHMNRPDPKDRFELLILDLVYLK